MKELEKQYNKDVEKPANFSLHRPSYMAGGRAALEVVLSWLDYSTEHEEIKDKIHDELESK